MKLFYVILGATPKGRNIEQHDVFFGIAGDIMELIPEMKKFWTNAKIHIDCWQEVRFVEDYEVIIQEKQNAISEEQLFFINLGGYKAGVFAELHEQQLFVGKSMSEAVKKAKKTDFYKNMSFDKARSHIDEKYGVDVDDVFNVYDIMPAHIKEKFSITLQKSSEEHQENFTKIGYLKI